MRHGSRGKRVRVVIQVSLLLHVATSSNGKSVELGVEVGLRLDERSAVITHGLVAGVWVLGENSVEGRNEDHDQQDK